VGPTDNHYPLFSGFELHSEYPSFGTEEGDEEGEDEEEEDEQQEDEEEGYDEEEGDEEDEEEEQSEGEDGGGEGKDKQEESNATDNDDTEFTELCKRLDAEDQSRLKLLVTSASKVPGIHILLVQYSKLKIEKWKMNSEDELDAQMHPWRDYGPASDEENEREALERRNMRISYSLPIFGEFSHQICTLWKTFYSYPPLLWRNEKIQPVKYDYHTEELRTCVVFFHKYRIPMLMRAWNLANSSYVLRWATMHSPTEHWVAIVRDFISGWSAPPETVTAAWQLAMTHQAPLAVVEILTSSDPRGFWRRFPAIAKRIGEETALKLEPVLSDFEKKRVIDEWLELGILKTISTNVLEKFATIFAKKKEYVCDPLMGDEMRELCFGLCMNKKEIYTSAASDLCKYWEKVLSGAFVLTEKLMVVMKMLQKGIAMCENSNEFFEKVPELKALLGPMEKIATQNMDKPPLVDCVCSNCSFVWRFVFFDTRISLSTQMAQSDISHVTSMFASVVGLKLSRFQPQKGARFQLLATKLHQQNLNLYLESKKIAAKPVLQFVQGLSERPVQVDAKRLKVETTSLIPSIDLCDKDETNNNSTK
jgi:hypothetical protein